MKIGIIGLGRVFNHYLKNFIDSKFLKENELILCDSNKELISKFKNDLNCKGELNIEGLISQKPSFVIVASPSGLHYKHSKLCLENDINVLSEKPICMSIKEQLELTQIATTKNLRCGVIFQNRYNPSIKVLKKIVDEKFIGKINICSMKLHWCRDQDYYMDDWHGKWQMDGGVINQQAIHHLDVLQWINGPLEKVYSMEANLMNDLEAEDTMMACLKYQNKSLGTIEATTAFRPRDYEASITISGDNGFIKVGGIALNEIADYSFFNHDSKLENIISNSSEIVSSGYGNSHKKVINDFMDSIKNDKPFSIDIKSTLNTTKLVHALYKSSERNMLINVNNEDSLRLGK